MGLRLSCRVHYKSCKIFCRTLSCLLLFLIAVATSPPAAAASSEAKISRAETEELFRSLDSILHFASDESGLRIVHSVKRKLVPRDAVEENIRQRMKNDKDAQRLQRSEIVLKKFGFLPRDFDLQAYLVSLLREQVAGFYNLHDQTVYLLDWIPADQQKPIMAHELTHALQDQNFHLQSWLKGGNSPGHGGGKESERGNHENRASSADDLEIETDELQTARQALAEGQGMVVMIDYLLKNSNQTVLTAPFFVEALKQSMAQPSSSPVLSKAPMYLRESLAFPYSYGMDFVRELLVKGGRKLAYEHAFENPPRNSRQIMLPKTYLAGERLDPVSLPAMKNLLPENYERYDVGSVGEFDIMVLLKQFSGEKVAAQLSPEWRGGAYYAALRRDHLPVAAKNNGAALLAGSKEAATTKSVALLYLSRWSSAEAAQKFANAYAAMLARRYHFAEPNPVASSFNGSAPTSHWQTDEGPVLIEVQDNTVLALEGYDPATELRLLQAIFEKPRAQGSR